MPHRDPGFGARAHVGLEHGRGLGVHGAVEHALGGAELEEGPRKLSLERHITRQGRVGDVLPEGDGHIEPDRERLLGQGPFERLHLGA